MQPPKGKIYFRFKQGLVNVKYLTHVYLILKPYLTMGSPTLEKSFDSRYDKHHLAISITISTKFNDM